MKNPKLAALPSRDERIVLFEITSELPANATVGAVLRGQGGKASAAAVVETLEGLGEYIRENTEELLRPFMVHQPSPLTPTEVEIEFGVKVAGKASIYIVEGAAESHIRVKVKWVRPPMA